MSYSPSASLSAPVPDQPLPLHQHTHFVTPAPLPPGVAVWRSRRPPGKLYFSPGLEDAVGSALFQLTQCPHLNRTPCP